MLYVLRGISTENSLEREREKCIERERERTAVSLSDDSKLKWQAVHSNYIFGFYLFQMVIYLGLRERGMKGLDAGRNGSGCSL